VQIRTVDAEREAIVGILAPQLGVLHHKASGYDLNFVLFSGTGETADLAKRYTAEALCDLFTDIGIRLVISDDINLTDIAADIAAEHAEAQDDDPNAPKMQRGQSKPMADGETLADVAPALIHNPKRDTDDTTPVGRLMAGMNGVDPKAALASKEAFNALSPRAKAYQFVVRMVKPLLQRQGCSVLAVDNSQDGLTEPTKITLHIELPTEVLNKGTRKSK
jgi:hypothetical protein